MIGGFEMSDENIIRIKYRFFAHGRELVISEEGHLLDSRGRHVICGKCIMNENLNPNEGPDKLVKLGAYYKEDEEGYSVKCQRCGDMMFDDFEKLKRKELII